MTKAVRDHNRKVGARLKLCAECGDAFHPLDFARHRSKHYAERQRMRGERKERADKLKAKEGVCGALIHVGFAGNTTCANPKPCTLHNEDGSWKSPEVISLKLSGAIPSKKNSKRIVLNRTSGKPFIVSSKAHEVWREAAGWELKTQMVRTGRKWPLQGPNAALMELWAVDRRKADLSDKWESVADLLVEHGVIADDNWYELAEVHLRFMGVDKADPRAMITIERLAL